MKQGDLDFDEFCDAYNAMIDKLGDLHASIREKAIQQSMILGMAQVSQSGAAQTQHTHKPLPTS